MKWQHYHYNIYKYIARKIKNAFDRFFIYMHTSAKAEYRDSSRFLYFPTSKYFTFYKLAKV